MSDALLPVTFPLPPAMDHRRIASSLVLLALVAVAVMSLGCATILKGSFEDLYITSNPPGATVMIDGRTNLGPTPVQVALVDSRMTHTLQLSLDGYADATVVVGNHVGVGWVLLDVFLTALVGVLVDGITGNWMELDTNVLHVEMRPIR